MNVTDNPHTAIERREYMRAMKRDIKDAAQATLFNPVDSGLLGKHMEVRLMRTLMPSVYMHTLVYYYSTCTYVLSSYIWSLVSFYPITFLYFYPSFGRTFCAIIFDSLSLSRSLSLSSSNGLLFLMEFLSYRHTHTHTHTHTRRLQYRSSRKEWTRSHDSAWHGSENNSQGTCNILFLATTLSCTF